MGTRWKTQTYNVNRNLPISSNSVTNSVSNRNLGKYELGGVIFGCNNNTIKECHSKQLLGLPAWHFNYVKHIVPGLPLFMFNYTDRKLHGIFEASSKGKMNIDPYAWTGNFSNRTQYSAQVQFRVRFQCHPLSEDKFRQVIADNYYTNNKFCFELDHRQANKLLYLLASVAIAPSTPAPQSNMKWKTVCPSLPSHETLKEGESLKIQELEIDHFTDSTSTNTDSTSDTSSLDGEIQPMDHSLVEKEVNEDEKNLVYMKLLKLSRSRELIGDVYETSKEAKVFDVKSKSVCPIPSSYETLEKVETLKMDELETVHFTHSTSMNTYSSHATSSLDEEFPSVDPYVVEKEENEDEKNLIYLKLMDLSLSRELSDDVCENPNKEKLCQVTKSYLDAQTSLEKKKESSSLTFEDLYTKLRVAKLMHRVEELTDFQKTETQKSCYLEDKLMKASLEIQHLKERCANVAKTTIQPSNEQYLDHKESLSSKEDYEGKSWLSVLDLCFHSHYAIKPPKPISSLRLCTSAVQLNSEVYVFGDENGFGWRKPVESYSPILEKWTLFPSLPRKKESLVEAPLNTKIFSISGRTSVYCFSDVEMLDLNDGRCISICSILDKRFHHADVKLYSLLYPTYGYNGFDNLKYALGGIDECTMASSIKLFDPCFGASQIVELKNHL